MEILDGFRTFYVHLMLNNVHFISILALVPALRAGPFHIFTLMHLKIMS